jgi:hypothetical protein
VAVPASPVVCLRPRGAATTKRAECNRQITSTDFRAELPGIFVSTLIVHGDTDASRHSKRLSASRAIAAQQRREAHLRSRRLWARLLGTADPLRLRSLLWPPLLSILSLLESNSGLARDPRPGAANPAVRPGRQGGDRYCPQLRMADWGRNRFVATNRAFRCRTMQFGP